jgi:hypothetical protein
MIFTRNGLVMGAGCAQSHENRGIEERQKLCRAQGVEMSSHIGWRFSKQANSDQRRRAFFCSLQLPQTTN